MIHPTATASIANFVLSLPCPVMVKSQFFKFRGESACYNGGMNKLRGIRGAVTVNEDTKPEVLEATRELLEALVRDNQIDPEDIASVFFSTTQDIRSVFPAEAARMLGWTSVPLFCSRELDVIGSLPSCIRVLIHWNTEKPQADIKHVYLREAKKLRPDLSEA